MINFEPIHVTSYFPSPKVILIGRANQIVEDENVATGFCRVRAVFKTSETANFSLGKEKIPLITTPIPEIIPLEINDFHFEFDRGGAEEYFSGITAEDPSFEIFYVSDTQRRSLLELECGSDEENEDEIYYSIHLGELFPLALRAYGNFLMTSTIPERADTKASREVIREMERELRTTSIEASLPLGEKLDIARTLLVKDYAGRFTSQ
jgi:hypothetical protein